MKIALIGYGKMGHAIEAVALHRGHEIVCIVEPNPAVSGGTAGTEVRSISDPLFREAEVAIEFTTPATAKNNILAAWEQGVPVVSGTTGWGVEPLKTGLDKQTLVWSSNYSIGVNILFAVNKRLAELMQPYDYTPSITEIHHIHKLDKPSGTAKTLSEQIADAARAKTTTLQEESIAITSVREGEEPGRHIVKWESEADSIELIHQAKSREGFALGAVLAAEWVVKNHITGFHTMDEVLNIH